MDVGDDGTDDWSYSGEFSSDDTTSDFSSVLNSYLSSSTSTKNPLKVPLNLSADSMGSLGLSNLNVQYEFYDVTPPEMSNTYILSNPTVVGDKVKIFADVTDDYGVDTVQVEFDGATYDLVYRNVNNLSKNIQHI